MQNEALNLGFECQRPDILGQADLVFWHGLMSPFIFITYFYPVSSKEEPPAVAAGLWGKGWVSSLLPSAGGPTPAGLCRGRVQGAVDTEARQSDSKWAGATGLGVQRGCREGFPQTPLSEPACSAWGCCAELKTISISGNARTRLFPSRTRSCLSPVPRHHGEETWEHAALKGTGMHSLSQIFMPALPSSPKNDCVADGSDV